jgi:molybdopterin-guanine dinucleotide biosynthesis protein B
MSSTFKIPVLGFAAYSGTGKTTLLKQLIPLLRKSGLHLALIKHSHHDFEIDHPGKDSYELRHAGAEQTLITSAYRSAWILEKREQQEPDLLEALSQLDTTDIDLVLVEGFRHDERLPCIELRRAVNDRPALYTRQRNIIALACDHPIQTDLPQLDINSAQQVCEFIVEWLNQKPGD